MTKTIVSCIAMCVCVIACRKKSHMTVTANVLPLVYKTTCMHTSGGHSTRAAPALLAQVRRPDASYVSEPYSGWVTQSL